MSVKDRSFFSGPYRGNEEPQWQLRSTLPRVFLIRQVDLAGSNLLRSQQCQDSGLMPITEESYCRSDERPDTWVTDRTEHL